MHKSVLLLSIHPESRYFPLPSASAASPCVFKKPSQGKGGLRHPCIIRRKILSYSLSKKEMEVCKIKKNGEGASRGSQVFDIPNEGTLCVSIFKTKNLIQSWLHGKVFLRRNAASVIQLKRLYPANLSWCHLKTAHRLSV